MHGGTVKKIVPSTSSAQLQSLSDAENKALCHGININPFHDIKIHDFVHLHPWPHDQFGTILAASQNANRKTSSALL